MFYDDDGEPTARTENPIDFGLRGVESIIRSLKMALRDTKRPVLDDAEIGVHYSPASTQQQE